MVDFTTNQKRLQILIELIFYRESNFWGIEIKNIFYSGLWNKYILKSGMTNMKLNFFVPVIFQKPLDS